MKLDSQIGKHHITIQITERIITNQADVNEKKLHLFKRKKKDANDKTCVFFKKRGMTSFFIHKSQMDVGS